MKNEKDNNPITDTAINGRSTSEQTGCRRERIFHSPALITEPKEVYGANNFHVYIRLIQQADTIAAEYAITHRIRIKGVFN